jgi:hypothetical protein
MQCKRTVARIGSRLLRSYLVEREKQCANRWHFALKHNIDRATARTGKWTPDEDSKLKDAVHTRGDKSWGEISELVPGRTRHQCHNRWRDALDTRIDRANKRTGTWTEDEDSKLEDAVKTHGGKNWVVITALVPGRTRNQCYSRWHNVLDPNINRATGIKGAWTENEDSKLKDAVQRHGGKNWAAISALVPGRTQKQCNNRHGSQHRSSECTRG